MGVQGWAQIVLYSAILIALAYPLGIWMTRVYTRDSSDPVERLFIRLLGRDAATDQDWKAYAKSVLIFSIVFGRLARLPSDGIPYPLFAYCALVPWGYFSNVLAHGSTSLVEHGRLITKRPPPCHDATSDLPAEPMLPCWSRTPGSRR